MIEINLISNKKSFKMPVVLGVDFADVKLKFFLLAAIVHYIPEMFIYEEFKAKEEIERKSILKVKEVFTKLKREMKPHRNLKRKLDAFNLQVQKLKDRSKQVDKIISAKSNPKFLLEGIARNIPTDVWFNKLNIDSKNNILIEGSAISYKSIGDFIISTNDTGFFGRSLNLSDSKTKEVRHEGQKVRVQSYTIKGQIKSYNPWVGQ